MISRRTFMKQSSLTAMAFSGLQDVCRAQGDLADLVDPGYGPLVPDPNLVIDLPEGFSYQVIARVGQQMDDGYVVPDKPDGMATFPGPDGTMILIKNHEVNNQMPSANLEQVRSIPSNKVYDTGGGKTPAAGGTTTLVYDTRSQKVIKQFMSLAGTDRNCAGGPTPWGSWVTCEESVVPKGSLKKKNETVIIGQNHGYAFEVPVTAEVGLADPIPLKAMGRFKHEAVAVDPRSGIVYETEDEHEGLFYRFIPDVKTKLQSGTLQMLVVKGSPGLDTRNWKSTTFKVGDEVEIEWMDIAPEPEDGKALRFTGFAKGAAKFARGEGMWWDGEGSIYFACTNGGNKQLGQIWRLRPGENRLELFAEPNDSAIVVNADNLTVAPFGDLIVCEDRSGDVVRLIGVTPTGKFYTFANNHKRTELCGAVFSPDGSTLFVNLQHIGMTLAITGPWDKKA
jgi:uncharacterized protein